MNALDVRILSDGDIGRSAAETLFRAREIRALGRRTEGLLYLAFVRLAEGIAEGPDANLEDGFPWLWSAVRQAGSGVPLSIYRLVVEESRFQAWLRIDKAVELVDLAVRVVENPKLAQHGEKLHQDLLARAHAYLGEAFRLRRQHLEAEQEFAAAERHRGLGSGDPEVEATLCEVRAALALDQGELALAGRRLEKATLLLRGSPELERRLAAVLTTQGFVLLKQGDSAGGRQHLLEAIELLPAESYPRLRLIAEHQLANEQVIRREYDAAFELLTQAAPRYERYADGLMEAQRYRLLGVIYYVQRRWKAAEEMLSAAANGFRHLGHADGEAVMLLALGSLYRVWKRPRKLLRVLRVIFAEWDKPPLLRVLLSTLHEVRRSRGEDPMLSASIAELTRLLEAHGTDDGKPN